MRDGRDSACEKLRAVHTNTNNMVYVLAYGVRERKCAWMMTKRDVLSFASRQCVALASISSGSLGNPRLPSSPGIRTPQVRSRRSLVLSQDKVGCANIFKVIFVHQMPRSEARPCVAVHLKAAQKAQNTAPSHEP